jgi:putative lipoic acid-binding regulatory protein
MGGNVYSTERLDGEIIYPRVMAFKAVFRAGDNILPEIQRALRDNSMEGIITARESSGGKFISFTIEAEVPSAEILESLCGAVAEIKGFMSLF